MRGGETSSSIRGAATASSAAGFTLIEVLAVLVVVALVAGSIVPRLPHAGSLVVRAAAESLATRLSASRERAILGGSAVRVDVADGLPAGVALAALDVGGTRFIGTLLALGPDGDALPVVVTLADDAG